MVKLIVLSAILFCLFQYGVKSSRLINPLGKRSNISPWDKSGKNIGNYRVELDMGIIVNNDEHESDELDNCKRANVQNYPYLVRLQGYITSEHLCSGVIISNKHVLTAAHCICEPSGQEKRPDYLTVKAGLDNYPTQEHRVKLILCHPVNYVDSPVLHDIGILAIFTTFTFDSHVNKIDLNFNYNEFLSLPKKLDITAIGWNNKLSKEDYERNVQDISAKVEHWSQCNDEKIDLYPWLVCAVQRGKKCIPDSGGPIFKDNKLVGILLSAICIDNQSPMYVVINVPYHMQWIRNATNSIF